MSLLDKFNAVEITSDSRITEADRNFCQSRQVCYEYSLARLRELTDAIHQYKETEKSMSDDGDNHYFHINGFSKEIKSSHWNFIESIISYFIKTYALDLNSDQIEEALIPEKPKYNRYDYDVELAKKINQQHDEWEKLIYGTLVINYNDVLDHIFAQLNGLSFQELALQQLKDKARRAGNYIDRYSGEPQKALYTLKSNTLTFDGCYRDYGHWELYDRTKDILRAASHFEFGNFDTPTAYGWRDLLGSWHYDSDQYDMEGKIIRFKSFKNRRFDIKFASPQLAQQFVDEYLKV